MPAAAVIPAPIVYANFVAVKKLVVEFLRESILCGLNELQRKTIFLILWFCTVGIRFLIVEILCFYFEKIRAFKAVLRLYIKAWNDN